MAAIVVLDTSFLGTASPAARTACMVGFADKHFVTQRTPSWPSDDSLVSTGQFLCAQCDSAPVAPTLVMCTCVKICRALCSQVSASSGAITRQQSLDKHVACCCIDRLLHSGCAFTSCNRATSCLHILTAIALLSDFFT